MKRRDLLLPLSAVVLMVSACNGEPAQTPAEEAMSAETGETAATPAASDEDRLQARGVAENWTEGADIRATYLAPIARRACEAIDTGDWAMAIPPGSAFASRGADARVLIAVADLDGARNSLVVAAADLQPDVRTAFDSAVANFMRHNLRAEDDRAGTGMHRGRDGRACIVQTDPDVIAELNTAIEAAQALSLIESLTDGG